MNTSVLEGKTIAILSANGFEESELLEPKQALEAAGATVFVVSPEEGTVQGMKHTHNSVAVAVDIPLDKANPDEYHGLVIPGGLFNPDSLRTNETALKFVQAFFKAGKPVGAICHGPQVLISADLVKGRTLTAVKAVQTDLRNAGATVKDEEVVVDSGLVTSRTPKDLPAFCKKLVEEFAESKHRAQKQKAA